MAHDLDVQLYSAALELAANSAESYHRVAEGSFKDLIQVNRLLKNP